MSSLKEIVYNIKNLRRGGKQSDDNPLSDKQIAFMVHYFRSLLIRREINKGSFVPDGFIQTLTCVDVSPVSSSECSELDYGCKILRTDLTIPKPLIWNQDDGLVSVGATDGSHFYGRTTHERSVWDKYGKYTGALEKYLYKNDYIYITNDLDTRIITIRAIFDNPEDVSKFNATNSICFDWHTVEYPCPMWMVNVITEMAITQELKFLDILPTDEYNDTKDVKSQTNPS